MQPYLEQFQSYLGQTSNIYLRILRLNSDIFSTNPVKVRTNPVMLSINQQIQSYLFKIYSNQGQIQSYL